MQTRIDTRVCRETRGTDKWWLNKKVVVVMVVVVIEEVRGGKGWLGVGKGDTRHYGSSWLVTFGHKATAH